MEHSLISAAAVRDLCPQIYMDLCAVELILKWSFRKPVYIRQAALLARGRAGRCGVKAVSEVFDGR